MGDKHDHKHDSPKDKPVDTSILNKDTPPETNPGHGLTEVDEQAKHRSGESIVEGGQNEQRGEPQPGYYSEAPGHQGGGRR